MLNYLKIARPDHWVKNIFIIPGIVFAVLLSDAGLSTVSPARVLTGFFATCFIASANYVINEWLDAPFDRFHPIKKNRPVVAGNMKFSLVMTEYALFAAAGILLSLMINRAFLLTELWLLVMGVVYNVKPLRSKDVVFLDVLSESINNMIRLLLGWFIVTDAALPPSSLLLGYWMGGAFLMAIKRFSEYHMIGDPKTAGLYRRSFAFYSEKSLMASAFFYGLISTFSIGVFLIKYRIEYLLAMPFIFLLFSYYVYISFDLDSAAQKPEKLYKDKMLVLILLLLVAVFLLATFIHMPFLDVLVSDELIRIGGR
ncbi:MAG: UbiA prenyltransferase family protein [Lachnospiraceae bacterium]|nr:UbiA prenyltransferase family protein [Lachnospiraceae bacterium]